MTLQRRWGRTPSNAEIAGYWPQIYDRNRGVIGGNPNLIHPGQVFVLP
jgi:nucleoid-associated protein YgaU